MTPLKQDVTLSEPHVSPESEPWDDPPRRLPTAASPVLSVEGFEGPLDWLIEMVRARKIDLARLSILALVEAFAEEMNAALTPGLPPQDLARWASWTIMAAQLTELRSRLMLPADAPDGQAARAEAEALRQHWLSRAEMVAAADWLDRRPQLGRDVFARGRPEPARAGQEVGSRRGTAGGATALDRDMDGLEPEDSDNLTELLRACLVALRLPVDTAIYQPRLLPFWTVSDAARRISQLLPQLPAGISLEGFLPDAAGQGAARGLHHRAALAATLVAGLEMVRGGNITLQQAEIWGSIMVT